MPNGSSKVKKNARKSVELKSVIKRAKICDGLMKIHRRIKRMNRYFKGMPA